MEKNLLKGWDFRTEQSVFSFRIHEDEITAIHSFNDNQIITVSLDKEIKVKFYCKLLKKTLVYKNKIKR